MNSLASTQRAFYSALLEPLAGRSRSHTKLPLGNDVLPASFKAIADRLIRESGQLTALERLELYHRQYWYRLLDSIEEDFPFLQKFLGPDRFWKIIERYLTSHPSRSFTLRHLGKMLPSFLDSVREIHEEELPWATAIASIEWAMLESFEALDLPVPAVDDFITQPVILQPHVRLLPLAVPAHLLCTDTPAEWRTMPTAPTLVVVWRTATGSVRFLAEDFSAVALLESTRRGGMLGDILERVAPCPKPTWLTDCFTRWQSRAWFGRPITPPLPRPSIHDTQD